MNFCSHCGSPVELKIPPGDSLPRYVCPRCERIHYQNPRVIAGCVAVWQGDILLCRRAIEPRHGLWTLPAGFMENGETTIEAAIRETREEACATPQELEPFSMVSVPHVDQVHLMFRGTLPDARHAPGIESLETRLVAPRDIPWDELAFPSVRITLERFIADLASGRFGFHHATVKRR